MNMIPWAVVLKILLWTGLLLGVVFAVFIIIPLAIYFRLLKVARVDFVEFLKTSSLSSKDFRERINCLLREGLAEQAALLCHRGEQLAKHILDEYGDDDQDARLMKRKLSFMKKRPDLFAKFMRLPSVTHDWDLEDEKVDSQWPEKSKQFKKDWEQIDFAFELVRTKIERDGSR
jgi:hypothetical protein